MCLLQMIVLAREGVEHVEDKEYSTKRCGWERGRRSTLETKKSRSSGRVPLAKWR